MIRRIWLRLSVGRDCKTGDRSTSSRQAGVRIEEAGGREDRSLRKNLRVNSSASAVAGEAMARQAGQAEGGGGLDLRFTVGRKRWGKIGHREYGGKREKGKGVGDLRFTIFNWRFLND